MTSLLAPNRKTLIGVVHLPPLPGSPRWQGSIDEIIEIALADARAYESGGANAIIIENFGDAPFTRSAVAAETLAAMAVMGRAIRESVGLPIGFNVLRNDPISGIALCVACHGSFIRVNVHTSAMLTDQGMIEGNAAAPLRYRHQLGVKVEIFADIHVKHAVPIGMQPIEDSARDALERGLADALIISGTGTGIAADLADVKTVRSACPKAKLLIGSGVTTGNVESFLELADGVIVGSSLKRGGKVTNPVDVKRVAALGRLIKSGKRRRT